MKILLLSFAILATQMNPQVNAQAISIQSGSVVRLRPGTTLITKGLTGRIVELANAAPTVRLPRNPPGPSDSNEPWWVDVKNMGPKPSTIVGPNGFSVSVSVGQTVHIYSNGSTYLLKH